MDAFPTGAVYKSAMNKDDIFCSFCYFSHDLCLLFGRVLQGDRDLDLRLSTVPATSSNSILWLIRFVALTLLPIGVVVNTKIALQRPERRTRALTIADPTPRVFTLCWICGKGI